jgi:ADP-heptose:LPS heptosyltransferase
MLAATAGIPIRLGYDVPECRPFLTHALPVERSTHALDQGHALAGLAARQIDATACVPPREPVFTIDEDERTWVESLLTEHGDSRHIIAIHPGSGAAVKNWLPERWRDVLAQLARSADYRFVLTGGTGEESMLAAAAAGLDPPPLSLAGRTTLGQLAALFERCRLVVGGDSGPLHLAAAVGTPTVRLFGPTDPDRFGPLGADVRHKVVRASLPCQPCGNIVAPPCRARGTPACLRVVSTAPVAEEVIRLLGGRDSPRC